MSRVLGISLLIVIALPLQAKEPVYVATAKHCLDIHMALSYQQNARLADYYADDAIIYNMLIDDRGRKQRRRLKGKEHKVNLKSLFANNQPHPLRDTYTNLSFQSEGNRVRVKGTKRTTQNYRDPFEMLIGVQGDEKCMVYEMTQIVRE